jgi:hypothetical protein
MPLGKPLVRLAPSPEDRGMGSLAAIVIHCRDPYVAGPFWATVLGMAPVAEDVEKLANGTALLRAASGLRLPVGDPPAGNFVGPRR